MKKLEDESFKFKLDTNKVIQIEEIVSKKLFWYRNLEFLLMKFGILDIVSMHINRILTHYRKVEINKTYEGVFEFNVYGIPDEDDQDNIFCNNLSLQ